MVLPTTCTPILTYNLDVGGMKNKTKQANRLCEPHPVFSLCKLFFFIDWLMKNDSSHVFLCYVTST